MTGMTGYLIIGVTRARDVHIRKTCHTCHSGGFLTSRISATEELSVG